MATLAAFSKTAHLFSVSACFGCSCWVTFVAGIVSWKALPRHTFGKLQSKLFPAYFRVTAGCLVVGLAALVSGLGRRWDSAPVACLTGALALQLGALHVGRHVRVVGEERGACGGSVRNGSEERGKK